MQAVRTYGRGTRERGRGWGHKEGIMGDCGDIVQEGGGGAGARGETCGTGGLEGNEVRGR